MWLLTFEVNGTFLTNPLIGKVRTLALELLKVPACLLLFLR